MKYLPNEIEAKWQQYWKENQTFRAENNSELPKYYVLDMFPYPSGAGLHVGHPLGYIASDIYARFKRHQGFNVLHPMGYDSFGLPAEQYAIQTGQHPAITTETNINRYREQLDKIGFSFDWSREVRTSEPDYYKWTQWIFLQLFDSWYNLETDKAEPIKTLINLFDKEGNLPVKAVCDEQIDTFSSDDWRAYSEEQKQKILLKYRLTYLAESEVNWCPALGTVLANDEIINGLSERGGHPVVRKKMTQWSMRISAYAERLLQGLDKIDWPEPLKEIQRNWFGKSVGALLSFNIKSHTDKKIDVFTTRPDTLFGVTFMTLAPEHELVAQITTPEQKGEVDTYVEQTAKRSERERMADVKTISGVFTGAYAEHPFTKAPIPVWIGDYVLAGYGTGAVMAVPCGDERDYAFANFFKGKKGMPAIKNIFNQDISEAAYCEKSGFELVNSDFLNGLGYKDGTQKAIESLEKIGQGKAKINYRLRDAVFSRQRYWGEPIPMYYKNGIPYPIPEHCLPLRLPEVEKYLPTEDGDPPLGNATVWAWDTLNNKVVENVLLSTPSTANRSLNEAEKSQREATIFPLELNTMPGWAGSSWYFNRYMDAHNDKGFASPEALAYWQDVDLYIGGSEHATGHLIYSRFWQKFMFDRGWVPADEFAKKLINQGMILGMSAFVYRLEGKNTFISKGKIGNQNVQDIHVDVSLVNTSDELDIDGFKNSREDYKNAVFVLESNGKYIVSREVEKMSKSKYNVVNPDEICEQYGADTLRMYEMFLGPLEQAKPWNTAGITGVFGFLKKLWKLYFDENGLVVTEKEPTKESLKTLHKTIKKVTEDIDNFSFNTSVSSFMIAVNELTAQNCHERAILEPLTVLISPYAPHIAEELWEKLGHQGSVAKVIYPKFEEKYLIESEKEYPVSFNGKMRFTINLSLDLSKEEIERAVLSDERTRKQLDGRQPKKIIIVPGKIVNIVE
ncbi:MAG: leucine--tRNA ligase [Bacteroidetes bacterium HGW-Bacteroidetes-13]|nr:MAG: leucine--tRNA ligase [Bacteroidetes bacterium HGW-Bacteroidetes-13]